MGVTFKRILFAINEQTGAMKTFGHFRSFEDLADKLTSIPNEEDPVGWPDGWTPYMFESCSGAFSHPLWYTPDPDGSGDTDAWLPVAFDPFVDLPLQPCFETRRGDGINESGEAYDAWIIDTCAPGIAELLRAEWKPPTETDYKHWDLTPGSLVAELGDLMMFAKPEDGKIEFQIHGVDPGGSPVYWRTEMHRWEDFA